MNKSSVGSRIYPTYKVEEHQDNKEFDTIDDLSKSIGEDRQIGDNSLMWWEAPIRRIWSNRQFHRVKLALDYHDIHPFFQHEMGTGYDGWKSENRDEFPRYHPFHPVNRHLQLDDGDYDEKEYPEPNKDNYPKRDDGVKYRDTDYVNEGVNPTDHIYEHNQDQSVLKFRGNYHIRRI